MLLNKFDAICNICVKVSISPRLFKYMTWYSTLMLDFFLAISCVDRNYDEWCNEKKYIFLSSTSALRENEMIYTMTQILTDQKHNGYMQLFIWKRFSEKMIRNLTWEDALGVCVCLINKSITKMTITEITYFQNSSLKGRHLLLPWHPGVHDYITEKKFQECFQKWHYKWQ